MMKYEHNGIACIYGQRWQRIVVNSIAAHLNWWHCYAELRWAFQLKFWFFSVTWDCICTCCVRFNQWYEEITLEMLFGHC